MARRILLVSKIHPINLPLFFLLSFIYKIKTFEMQLSRLYTAGKRIELLQLEKYFNWETCVMLRSDAVKIWEDILPEFPDGLWKIRVKDSMLDMSKKARQDVQKEIERLFLLKNIVEHYKNENSGSIYIINSLQFNFIRSISKNNELTAYPTINFLSRVNSALDAIFLYWINFFMGVKLIIQLIHGLSSREENSPTIKYVCDGISPRELSIDKTKNSFSWIIDDKVIHRDEVLFLLPEADFQMRHFSKEEVRKKGLVITSHYNMVCLVSRGILLSSLLDVFKSFFKKVIIPVLALPPLMNTKYIIQVLKWSPVIEYFKPKVYMNSSSCIGIEEPASIYFQNAGIKTVMWSYGTNSYLFTDKEKCDFRNINFCNILSSTFAVWNRHYKDFVESHVQDNLEVVITGPLMTGDETVFSAPPDIVRKRNGSNYMQDKKDFKYIAFFDAPPVSKTFIGSETLCPDSNSEEYNYTFIKDIFRLLSDFEDLYLLYKPKRSLTSGKFSYSEEMRDVMEEMHKNPRIIIFDYNINPWVPLASADMTVSMPFESTFIVSLHYDRPAIFHDPINIAHNHRYQDLPDLITHSYDELRSKVSYWLFDNEGTRPDIKNNSRFNDFVGADPAKNSSKRFREFLASL